MFKRIAFKPNIEIGKIDVRSGEVTRDDCISERGPHGSVYKCVFRGNNKVVAKYFKKPSSEFKKKFEEETTNLKKIFHPNILLTMAIINEDKVTAIVTELMRCSLDQIENDPSKCPKGLQKLNDLEKLRILRDVSVGLCWIHTGAGIPHGNIKPSNILFDENGTVKLADFGYSIYKTPVQVGNYSVCSRDSNVYQAPEVWHGNPVTTSSDVYSFGLIVHEFLVSKRTFYGDIDYRNDIEIFDAINTGLEIKTPEEFSDSLKKMLHSCLQNNPENRMQMDEVLGMFDSIVVDSTMKNEEARQYWKENITDGGVPLFELDYPSLHCTWISGFGDKDEDESQTIEESLKVKIFENKEIITAMDFDNIVGWFGPFFKDWNIVEEMMNVANQPWFYGAIDKTKAEGLLSGQPDKTFLIRYSFTDVSKTPFTLTRNVNGLVKHSRIERLSYSTDISDRYKITIDKKVFVATELMSLVEALKNENCIKGAASNHSVSEYDLA